MLLRAKLVYLHRWIGLAFALLLVSQGLTGTTMVFRDELNRLIHHDALTVVPSSVEVSVQAMLEEVRKAHPELQVTRIDYPAERTQAFLFRLEAPHGGEALRFIAVDPYRGMITRDEPVSAWPVQWLFLVHEQLLSGNTGQIIVGCTGIGLLLMTLSAPFLWWPGRRRLRQGFSINLKMGAPRAVKDLHRVGGVLVVTILFVSATTGIVTVWKPALTGALANITPLAAKPAAAVGKRPGVQLLPVDVVAAAARAHFSGETIRNVRFPGGHGRVVMVVLNATGSARPRASDQVWLNGYTHEILGVYASATLPRGSQLLEWTLPIHTGEALGTPGRLLFLLVALTLPALAVTGFLQWYRRWHLRNNARQEENSVTRTQVASARRLP